jgi:hypothetical protein
MTDFRDGPDLTERWRATIEALEALVQAAPEEEDIDPVEVDEVRRLITMRVTGTRRNKLPAAWVRRPGIGLPTPPEAGATGEATDRPEPPPQAAHPRAHPRPAWRE